MKKILLATTALVISGATASAQVSPAISIGGQGRMGVVHTRTAAAANLNALTAASNAANAAAAAAAAAAVAPNAAAAAAAANAAAAEAAFLANPNAANLVIMMENQANAQALANVAAAANANAAAAAAAAAAANAARIAGLASNTTVLEHRLRLNLSVNVQADHGVSMGAFVRSQSTDGTRHQFSGSRVWVEASGVRLTFGNQDGAIATDGHAGAQFVGYTGGTFNSPAGLLTQSGIHQFSSGGVGLAQLAAIRYSAGDYAVSVSHQRGGHTEIAGQATFDAITVAVGFANGVGTSRVSTLSVAYNGGSWGAAANVARVAAFTNWTLNGFADVAGGRVNGYIGRVANNNIWGVGYRYNLGGGAALAAGIERDWINAGRNTRVEVGAVFNF